MLVAMTGHSPQHMPNRRRLRSFHSLALAAQHFNLNFLLVQPQQLQSSTGAVVGWSLPRQGEPDAWLQSAVSFQQGVAYDAMYLSELHQQKAAYNKALQWLRRHEFAVFNPVLPSKDRLLQLVERSGLNQSPFPRTWYRLSHLNLTTLLETTSSVWLKPPYGSGGRNLVLIQRMSGNMFHVVAENCQGKAIQEEVNGKQLRRFIRNIESKQQRHMMQEHVNLIQTKDEKKADLRITVQRGEDGLWKVTAVTGRLSAPHSWLTNYHAGGSVESLSETSARQGWYEETGMTGEDIERASQLSLRLAQNLQGEYPLLGILGIDVGQDVNGSQFIYDCNSKPGRDILTDEEVSRFMWQAAGFARYLEEQKINPKPVPPMTERGYSTETSAILRRTTPYTREEDH